MTEPSNYVNLPINSEENDPLIDDKSPNDDLSELTCVCDGRTMITFTSGFIFVISFLGILIWYLF